MREYQRLFGDFPFIMLTVYYSHLYAAIYENRTLDTLRTDPDALANLNPLMVRAPPHSVW